MKRVVSIDSSTGAGARWCNCTEHRPRRSPREADDAHRIKIDALASWQAVADACHGPGRGLQRRQPFIYKHTAKTIIQTAAGFSNEGGCGENLAASTTPATASRPTAVDAERTHERGGGVETKQLGGRILPPPLPHATSNNKNRGAGMRMHKLSQVVLCAEACSCRVNCPSTS